MIGTGAFVGTVAAALVRLHGLPDMADLREPSAAAELWAIHPTDDQLPPFYAPAARHRRDPKLHACVAARGRMVC